MSVSELIRFNNSKFGILSLTSIGLDALMINSPALLLAALEDDNVPLWKIDKVPTLTIVLPLFPDPSVALPRVVVTPLAAINPRIVNVSCMLLDRLPPEPSAKVEETRVPPSAIVKFWAAMSRLPALPAPKVVAVRTLPNVGLMEEASEFQYHLQRQR